ncbi:hypothetical protein PLICRDRAFT_98105 [Plicaturopsis crispa FD-325 SS-3]|nr:hypothetical protein PLICRDRAFT_98105 [Plicaturopsis crispa FD-325 SS-3]
MRQFVGADAKNGWDNTWKANVTPWDTGAIQPPLREAVESCGLGLPRTGRALVPGCGRGYDAIYIASTLGLDTLALDISPTAVAEANKYVLDASFAHATLTAGRLAASANAPPGKVAFQEADFFTYTVSEAERFDLVYDYTFFVAIPPDRRPEWGAQVSALTKPGGYLITLVWPLDLPLEGGPPFHVELEDYPKVLGGGWEKVLEKVPESTESEKHKGRERLVVWRQL